MISSSQQVKILETKCRECLMTHSITYALTTDITCTVPCNIYL